MVEALGDWLFVVIVVIVDHYCLNFLFVILGLWLF
jgi:hypothetical protein